VNAQDQTQITNFAESFELGSIMSLEKKNIKGYNKDGTPQPGSIGSIRSLRLESEGNQQQEGKGNFDNSLYKQSLLKRMASSKPQSFSQASPRLARMDSYDSSHASRRDDFSDGRSVDSDNKSCHSGMESSRSIPLESPRTKGVPQQPKIQRIPSLFATKAISRSTVDDFFK
jgi:hypothetical protein